MGLLACLEPTGAPSGGGGLSLTILAPGNIAALDSGHVVVDGPTKKTVKATPGTTVKIDSLAPGSYIVALEGFSGGSVAYFGQTSGVSVVAGQNTNATVTFASFQTAILSMPTYTVDGQFVIVYSKVPGAAGYVVQRDVAASFATARDTAIAASDTSPQVSIPLTGPYNVRVLAVDPYGGRGVASAARAITTLTSVTVSPATASIAPGLTQQFTAVAKDALGNTVTGVTFFWVSSNQPVALVDQNGLATGIAGGTATISALGLGIPGGATLTVSAITPPVATQLAYTSQPTNATAGAAISPAIEVEVRDASGNRVTTARDAVTLTIASGPGGATLVGTTTVNALNGVGSFSGVTIQKAGTAYMLSASATSLTSATSNSFNISPAAPAKLAFTVQPSSAEGNVVFSAAVTVTVLDAFDNAATSASNLITITMGNNPWASATSLGGSLFGTTTVAASSGVATFSNLKVDKPANGYTIVASSGALTGATSSPFNIFLTMQSVAPSDAFGSHTCGIAAGGTYCWGYNFYGQLGGPTATLSGNTDPVAVLVRGGLTFTQVTAGYLHSCGLTAAGAAYCWGYNGNGQLGDGTTTNRATPVAVVAPVGISFTQIDAGTVHTCARASTSDVYCWGYNFFGQLGNGTTTNSSTPVKVTPGTTVSFASVSAGGEHTCGVDNNGNGYCWGYNFYGQLGNGAVLPGANSSTPVAVTGSHTFAVISAGSSHTCGVATGAGYCWGYNGNGQLGDGTTTNNSAPVAVTGGLTFATISAGESHSCGATTAATGKAGYCWGANFFGQLGDGTTTNSSTRVLVSGSLQFDAIKAGSNHTCGRVAGAGYCWGYNFYGQLGDGSVVTKGTPTQIVQ